MSGLCVVCEIYRCRVCVCLWVHDLQRSVVERGRFYRIYVLSYDIYICVYMFFKYSVKYYINGLFQWFVDVSYENAAGFVGQIAYTRHTQKHTPVLQHEKEQ